MATTYHNDIQKLYVAYFNRPADYAGLNFWESVVEAANGDTSAISAAFAQSAEYKAAYGALSAYEVVNAVYNNLFGRDADVAGLKFWAEALIAGTFTVDQAVTTIAAGAQNDDLTAYNNKVKAAAAFTDALDTTREILGYTGEAANNAGKEFLSGVTTDASLAAAIKPAALDATIGGIISATPVNAGKTFTLTTSADSFTGTANNDVFNAAYDRGVGIGGSNTLSGLDKLDGGAGNDTLNITNDTGTFSLPTTVTLSSIENVTIAGAGYVGGDFSRSNVTGLNNLAVTAASAVSLQAGTGTDVNVSGSSGYVDVYGGKNVTINTAARDASVFGNNDVYATGAVSVTHTNQAGNRVWIQGGTDVTVNASKITSGDIVIGSGAEGAAARGAVVVNATGAAYDGAVAHGTIDITGGTTVSVTQKATSSTAAAARNGANVGNEIRQGDVVIRATASTTSVTIKQDATVDAENYVAATAGVKQVDTVTIVALAQGESLTVGGLTFTASKALSAAQVAAAFANLSAGATQGAGSSANGAYSGTFGQYSTGAVTTTGTTVTIDATARTAASAVGAPVAIVVGDTAAAADASSVVKTAGTSAVAGHAGVAGIVGGSVYVGGNIDGDDVLKSVSLDGYGSGSYVASDALTTLNLANSEYGLSVSNAKGAALNLGLDNVGGDAAAAINLMGSFTSLNITGSGADSFVSLGNNVLQYLSVGGDTDIDLSTTSFGSLKTVTVTGAAGLAINASSSTVTAVDTTGTTGTVVASINASKATYTGGAGDDIVTLTNTTVSKAISTGAGDDTVNLAAGTTTLGAAIDGGEGVDTLGMAAADAATASATNAFAAKFTGFEKLSLGAAAAGTTATVNLANLNNIDYVISANAPAGTARAEVQSFAISSGTSAAVAKQQTFTIAATGTGTPGNLVIGDVVIPLTGNETADQIGNLIVNANNSIPQGSPIASFDYSLSSDTVTVLYKTSAGNADVPHMADTGTGVTLGQSNTTVPFDSNAGDITVGGVTVALTAGMTADQIGAAIANAVVPATSTIDHFEYANGTVSIFYKTTAGNVDNATIGGVTDTGATFGSVSETTAGSTGASASLTLTNMAANGTLELTGAGGGAIVQLADASGSADVFNIVTKLSTANLDYGTVTVAGVESVNLTVTDTAPTTVTGTASIQTATLNVADAALKSLVISGNANAIVSATSTALTSVDASAATGSVTFGTLATAAAAATVTGGAGNDVLTARHSGDSLVGGAGNDTLVVKADLVSLTGGAGADVFNVGYATTNVNSYATITDLSAGDVIKLADAFNTVTVPGMGTINFPVTETFSSSKVSLGETAVFQDYANAAINATNAGDITWFQFQGNTYIVEHMSTNDATSFVNGTDIIVRITGTVDLSTASFNSGNQTLLIG